MLLELCSMPLNSRGYFKDGEVGGISEPAQICLTMLKPSVLR